MRGAGHGGREFTVQIVGITVDPADRDASTLVVLDPSLAAEQATAWLSEKDPYSIPTLQPFMDRRTARYQSVTALVAQGGGNLSGFLAALRHVPLAMALLFLTVIVSTLALFKPMAVGMWRALSPRECPISERGDRCCESPSVQFSWASWSVRWSSAGLFPYSAGASPRFSARSGSRSRCPGRSSRSSSLLPSLSA